MGTALAPNKPKPTSVATLKDLLASPQYAARFREVLGERAPQFCSSILSVANGFSRPCDPKTVISSAMTAATLDLPVNKDLGFAWIVPYNGVAQFQMGYKGFVQLALRTGQYRTINVSEIREGEYVSYNKLTGKLVLSDVEHPDGNIVGYAAYFELVNGFEKSEYWKIEDVKNHAQRFSQSYRSGRDSPWKSDFDAMAKKTVLKSLLSHWGILSVQMQDAIRSDQGVRQDPGAEMTYIDNNGHEGTNAEAENKTDALADALESRLNESMQNKAEDENQDATIETKPPQVKNGKRSPEKYGKDSPAWAAFEKEHDRVGHNYALDVKEQLGMVNTPFDRLRTEQLITLTSELAKFNPEADPA